MPIRRDRPLVFIHSSDELYGADRVLLDLIDALAAADRSRAQVWLPTDIDHPRAPLCGALRARGIGVRHRPLPIMRRSYLNPRALVGLAGRLVMLVTRLAAVRPQTVYCTTSASFLAAPVARMCGVPHVVGHVQEHWSGAEASLLSLLGRSCDRLIAISGSVCATIPDRLHDRTRIVMNSSPAPARYQPLSDRSGPLTYLVASRWNLWKGHRTLLRAWQEAGCPGTLVVLGGPPPSGAAVDVVRLAAQVLPPGTVRIVGEVSDIGPDLDQADVMVVPSDSPEPFGLVASEAFARGRPVLCSAGGGLREVVTDGQDGWCYPIGDAAGLAEVLRGLDRPTVHAAGARARTTYLARFTPERYAAEWRVAAGLAAAVAAADSAGSYPTMGSTAGVAEPGDGGAETLRPRHRDEGDASAQFTTA